MRSVEFQAAVPAACRRTSFNANDFAHGGSRDSLPDGLRRQAKHEIAVTYSGFAIWAVRRPDTSD
jgi:hypothetical protein